MEEPLVIADERRLNSEALLFATYELMNDAVTALVLDTYLLGGILGLGFGEALSSYILNIPSGTVPHDLIILLSANLGAVIQRIGKRKI